jgi:6-phosphogluconolactonase
MMRFRFKAISAALLCLAMLTSRADVVYVGSQAREIQAFHFDTSSGTFTRIGKVADGLRPTWLIAHPQLPVLYAVDDDNAKQGTVTAFGVDRESGALTKLGDVGANGTGTTNLSIDIPSMTLLAANYGSGSVSSMAIETDGSLGAAVSTAKESGSGPNKRQASAHAHNAVVDPSGRYVLVPDLGADRVFVYGFDRATHRLNQNDAHAFVAPFGSGPRHLVFGANGRFVYLITELSAEVMVLRWNASQGTLTRVQSIAVSSVDFQGVKSGAEIAVSHDGRFVYVENRGENQLIVYRVDAGTGALSELQRTSAGGDKPWSFTIDASGKWMLVANQKSGQVSVFSIDPSTGKLTDTQHSIDITTPVSIAFIR